MTPWMRTLHKWVGLIIGLQLLLWMASGVMMSWLDHDQVQGHEFQAHEHAAHEWPANARSPASFLGGNKKVSRVSSGWLLDTPVYQLADARRLLQLLLQTRVVHQLGHTLHRLDQFALGVGLGRQRFQRL